MALAARLPTDGARIDCQGLKSQPDDAAGRHFGTYSSAHVEIGRGRALHCHRGGIRQDSGEIASGH